ncbi:hypothetical protein CBS115989_4303 [Aspergillus niger]|nr:hypothetical protein CBS115989_4303 [Aspergillus niger]KAI2855431.1 hypothetical protein CBS11232_4466 [Aspergillus niger]KAI2876455.1 hypothetical protein CBS115988_4722 [Aspergillus niger]
MLMDFTFLINFMALITINLYALHLLPLLDLHFHFNSGGALILSVCSFVSTSTWMFEVGRCFDVTEDTLPDTARFLYRTIAKAAGNNFSRCLFVHALRHRTFYRGGVPGSKA